MSIYAKYEYPSETTQFPTLHLRVTNADIVEFKQLLDRALNCADPHKYKTWVELSDKLAQKLQS